jgi:hypothetical protein
VEHPPPAKTDGTNRRIEEELALKHNELRSTNSLTLAILGQSCRAASLLLLTAFVPFSADADDGRKALRIAGCGEGVIDAFLREGKKAAIMQAQEKRNFSCIRAVMRLKDKHKIPDTEAPIHSEPVPMSQDPNPEPISEFAINAEKKWRDRLNKVRCPTLVEKAARLNRTWICSPIRRSSTTTRIAPSLLPRPIAYVEMVIRGMLWRKK